MKLAIIPARSGNKHIPRNNIKPLCGKAQQDAAVAALRASFAP